MPKDYYYDKKMSNLAMSRVTSKLLSTFNIHSITQQRRVNFNLYLNELSMHEGLELPFAQLPEGVCPLLFPLIVRNRAFLCEKLNERAISAIEWWSGYHQELPWNEFPDACFLKDNLLGLPVHQSLDENDIRYIAKVLIDLVS
ncbi:MAG: hypothetical protein NT066_06720 [Candidatus Omnitrophica bacterium]|nr:hypothetical protein [Candidatus Omnitrophota bacterium]